uniref:Uncharacterized protein n=1 Tax=Tanacetum cinerariifolium TaxID=118510 RepID=A0A6L2KH99_TANCI|nr:hypothetical protein [Tanacetum cinerariifolium]
MSTGLEEIRSAIVGGGNHPNREGDERGIHRSHTNFKGFNDNHEHNQPLKQVWRHDDMISLDEEEGEETLDEYNNYLEEAIDLWLWLVGMLIIVASEVPMIVSSSRTLTASGQVTNSLAVCTLYSALAIVMKLALVAQW